MKAHWKTVEGHEDYLVSDKGEILSMKNTSNPHLVSKETIHKDEKSGFNYVILDGTIMLVQDVVAQNFIGPVDKYSLVFHKNGNVRDNQASNLKIVSKLERKRNAKEEKVDAEVNVDATPKVIVKKEGKRRGAPKKAVYAINLNTGEKMKFSSVSGAANELGIAAGCISSVLTGRLKTAGGYTFERACLTPHKWSRKAIPVMVENVKTGETTVYRSSTEASPLVGVGRKTIAYSISNNSIVKGTYRFTAISEEKYLEMKENGQQQETAPKKASMKNISIKCSDAKEWNGTGFKPVPVYVKEHKNNKLRCFDSISDAARKLGISLAVVRDLIDGKKVADGYSFSKDFPEIQKVS